MSVNNRISLLRKLRGLPSSYSIKDRGVRTWLEAMREAFLLHLDDNDVTDSASITKKSRAEDNDKEQERASVLEKASSGSVGESGSDDSETDSGKAVESGSESIEVVDATQNGVGAYKVSLKNDNSSPSEKSCYSYFGSSRGWNLANSLLSFASGSSVENDSGIKLLGDGSKVDNVSATLVYGSDGTNKGWYDAPSGDGEYGTVVKDSDTGKLHLSGESGDFGTSYKNYVYGTNSNGVRGWREDGMSGINSSLSSLTDSVNTLSQKEAVDSANIATNTSNIASLSEIIPSISGSAYINVVSTTETKEDGTTYDKETISLKEDATPTDHSVYGKGGWITGVVIDL